MLNYLKESTNYAMTANRALVYETTGSAVMDFFSKSGALRNIDVDDKNKLFSKAFAEDNLLALKALFYMRDCRAGQGERDSFRDIARYMADYHTDAMRKNLSLVPYFGRWDDMYAFVGTRLEKDAFAIMYEQFCHDISKSHPSVLAKWLASENASSYRTKQLAKKTREAFKLSPKSYRKLLSGLRERIRLLERDMSANNWTNIDYSFVPSQAGVKYRNAFLRHDEAGYVGFLESLKRGDSRVKINTKTLFPYEVIRDAWTVRSANEADSINVTWDNLPDYFGDNKDNSVCVVDTSGSMSGLPIQIAISLGIYSAERNKGKFHNHFITFSDRPQLVEIQGSNICEKVRNMSRANWGYNTNIEAVFKLILNTAVSNNVPQEEMIDRIIIISDMQFDSCITGGNNERLFETIERKYAEKGYKMPSIVFWTVNQFDTKNTPAVMTKTGVQLVSGASSNLFVNILKGKYLSAYDLMLNVLNNDRYSVVTV